MLKPVARTDHLIAEDIWDETVVYDQTDNQVHRLNASAAAVWRHCDGTRTIADLATVLHERMNVPADEALVHLALDTLGQANLLLDAPLVTAAGDAISRRELLDRLKVAAYLLPVVASIVAPPPDAAASTITGPGGNIVPSGGLYSGTCLLSSQTCNPVFFNNSFTETLNFNAGLTSCTLAETGGSSRVSSGTVTGSTYTGTGSGLIGTFQATWIHTATWTSNTTINFTEIDTIPSKNCSGTFNGTQTK